MISIGSDHSAIINEHFIFPFGYRRWGKRWFFFLPVSKRIYLREILFSVQMSLIPLSYCSVTITNFLPFINVIFGISNTDISISWLYESDLEVHFFFKRFNHDILTHRVSRRSLFVRFHRVQKNKVLLYNIHVINDSNN